jgi:aquaporin Z
VQATKVAARETSPAWEALAAHWPEYLMEAAALGMFMVSACTVAVLLAFPASPVSAWIPDPAVRRVIGGIAMGLTAIGIICSPWGQRSGAHMNPALTLAFFTLGKIAPWDAVFYMASQFGGGTAGVLLSHWLIGPALAHPTVNYVATLPGPQGPRVAFAAEFAISLLLVSIVLRVANSRKWSRYTPLVAGCMVAIFISFESPLSGMSMNPARSLASALPSGLWTAFWIYLTAPPIAMVAAAQLYRRGGGVRRVFCAKLHHHNHQRCIFRCNYGALQNEQ